jgi:hypothetical protein
MSQNGGHTDSLIQGFESLIILFESLDIDSERSGPNIKPNHRCKKNLKIGIVQKMLFSL